MTSRLLADLKQTRPFARPGQEAIVSILRTAAVLEYEINEALKPFDLTMTQYNVLRILRGAEPAGLCGREVGERLITSLPDVPRLLDRMTDAGLVGRKRDSDDRRHVTARITAAGLRLLDEVQPKLDAVERRRTGSLSRDAIRSLLLHLEQVRSGT
jgi:DNA-binding MarR family transcriptional regulator